MSPEDQGSATTQDTGNVTPIREAVSEPPAPKPSRPRLSHPLPTNRVAVKKQLEVGRAFAIASGPEGKPAKTAEVATIAQLHQTTIQLVSPFFQDAGLIQKVAGGYLPSEALVNFNRAYAWDEATAGHRLAPTLRGTWFTQALMPRVALHPVDEGEAVQLLAETAGVGPEYEGQLRLLLDYLGIAGLIVREGGMVRQGTPAPQADTPRPPSPQQHEPAAPTPPSVTPRLATGFAKDIEGGMQFSVQFRMAASDFEGWDPARIAAFFAGIAQVLAAKGGI